MKHICNNCKKTTELTHNFEYVTFVCPHCKQVHRHTEKEQNETIAGNYTSKENYTLSLKVGDVGTLLSDTYQVTGALVKRTSRELWNEYSLMNVETKAIKYLIELDGTWAIEEEIEPTHPNYYYYVTQSYNNKYSLYQHEQDVRLLTAEGFFDHIISQKPYQLYDYISPPYIISVEKRKNETWYFAGQRVLSDDVSAAFPHRVIPFMSSDDILEPPLFNIVNYSLILLCCAVLIAVTNGLLNASKISRHISMLTTTTTAVKKEQISSSFTVEYPTQILITAYCKVNQEWVYSNIALVNEKTNEVRYVDNTVSYYSGHEGSTYWEEGGSISTTTLCCIPKGTYHIVVAVEQNYDTEKEIGYKIEWNYPSTTNMKYFCGLILAIWALTYVVYDEYIDPKSDDE